MLGQESEPRSITEYFSADHRRIDKLIGDICAMIEDGELERAEYSTGDLDAGLRRHIELEEQVLFRLFESHVQLVGPTTVMRKEHRQIEGWLDELRESLAEQSRQRASTAMAKLVQVLVQHNLKEEAVIYPRTDAALSPAERSEALARLSGT